MATKIARLDFLPITISDIVKEDVSTVIGSKRTIQGWAKSCRIQDKGDLLFIEIQDGTTTEHIQAVICKSDFKDIEGVDALFDKLKDIKTGYSLKLTGQFVKSPAKGQLFELRVSRVYVIGECPPDYILQKHSAKTRGVTLDTLRQTPHLRCRAQGFQSVSRIRDRLMRETHDFYGSQGFVWAAAPIITFSDCEGAGETFLVRTTYKPEQLPPGGFFGQEAYLTVSGQLEGEMLAMAHSRVYTFGPTFRAEKSKTTRHLSEFWMIEPEVCFIDLMDLIKLAEAYVKQCIAGVLTHCAEDVKQTLAMAIRDDYDSDKEMYAARALRIQRLEQTVQTPFVVISYTQAIEKLVQCVSSGDVKFDEPVSWGIDMSSEHEKYLTDVVFKSAVAVHSYPYHIKAFYMKRYKEGEGDTRCVKSFDLLVPEIGELIGGSIREHDYDTLVEVMQSRQMDIALYKEYLDLRLFGTCEHGGFGLGFERLVRYVTGIRHIRDTIPFPRAY